MLRSWLRDRLSFLDRQGSVIVGKLVKRRRQKRFTRHVTHGIENQLGPDASREDGLFNHLLSEFPEFYVQGSLYQPIPPVPYFIGPAVTST
jgi:hypothetical protein